MVFKRMRWPWHCEHWLLFHHYCLAKNIGRPVLRIKARRQVSYSITASLCRTIIGFSCEGLRLEFLLGRGALRPSDAMSTLQARIRQEPRTSSPTVLHKAPLSRVVVASSSTLCEKWSFQKPPVWSSGISPLYPTYFQTDSRPKFRFLGEP